jgi:uncharacterized coiled-coil protein SlyX
MEDVANILKDIERRLKDIEDQIRKQNDILATMSQALTLFVVSTLQGKVEGGIKDGSKRD